MKKKIKQHEEQYWHIPKFSILPILGLILFSLLAIGNYQLIDKEVLYEVFSQDTCVQDKPCNLIPTDLINIYPIIGEYILISLALISLVALFKGGYSNLKSYDEEGLIAGLISCSIISLIALIAGLISCSIISLIVAFIAALISVLFILFIFIFIFALLGEFD